MSEEVKNGNPTNTDDHAAPSAAIVRAPQSDDTFRFALEPSGFREAQTVAAIVAKTGMCGVKTPEEALVRLMTGRTLGIPSFVALQHVYDVEGRPSLSAKLKVALCLRHPECEKFEHVESDHQHATYRAKRRGLPEKTVTFTIDDAKRAGLVKEKSNWEKWPRRMVQARASSELADILFPDACMGMPTVEESYDARAIETTGEIVQTASDMAKSVIPTHFPGAAAAPERDWASEAALLKHRIQTAKTQDERASVRPDVAKFLAEAPEPHLSDVKDYYNATAKLTKSDAKQTELGNR
jgi:hypothetical protein